MAGTILVTGATGKQGGAVIQALIAPPSNGSMRILALTRKPDSKAALKLASISSVTVITGDLDSPDIIFSEPIWAVFSVQLGVDPSMTKGREIAQGTGLIDAAARHGVKHFVYASADLGDPPRSTNVPQLQSKLIIEKHLRSSSIPTWTILQPVIFFENLSPDINGNTFAAALKYYIDPKRTLQFVATEDIGLIAAKAILEPSEYNRKTIRIAGDSMDYKTMSKIFQEEIGRPLPLPWGWWFLPWLVFKMILPDLGIMYKDFSDNGFDVDIDKVKKIHPELMDYRAWLRQSAFRDSKSD